MKSKHLVLPLICFAFLSVHCRKDKSKPSTTLPPITQEGKNTFGCKVDGEVWVPFYKCNIGNNPCGELSVDVYKTNPGSPMPLSFSIRAGIKNSDNSLSYFVIETNWNQGIHSTGNKIDSVTVTYLKTSGLDYYNYNYYNKLEKFEIKRLDVANNILAGEFELTLYNSFSDSVRITDGRFDFQFGVCKCSN